MMMSKIKEIPGYSGRYGASSDGRIWSFPKRTKTGYGAQHDGKFLKDAEQGRGYRFVNISGSDGKQKTKLVHRLVAMAFLPNPNNFPEVNHKNGVRHDNRVENLEWCNGSQNMQNAIERGTFDRKGSKHPLAKLTEEKVKLIRDVYASGKMQQKEIAEALGIHKSLVSQVTRRIIWQHI